MSDAMCIANIGPGERRKRLGFGLVALGAGAAVTIGLAVAGMSWAWGLAVLPLYWMGTIGCFQWRDRT